MKREACRQLPRIPVAFCFLGFLPETVGTRGNSLCGREWRAGAVQADVFRLFEERGFLGESNGRSFYVGRRRREGESQSRMGELPNVDERHGWARLEDLLSSCGHGWRD